MDQIYGKLAHYESKTIPVLEIKDLLFMLRSIKQRAFLTHSVVSTDNGKSNILLL